MDTRKIQSVGGGTYTVSLPKEWAESQGINTGDTVNLHTHIDGILAIQAQECRDDIHRRISVPVTHGDAHSLERILRAAYAVGVKEVVLDADETFTPKQKRAIHRVVRNLTGVSVVEGTDTKITVRTLLNTDEVSVRQSVRQLKYVALSMHRDATAALTGDARPGNLANRDDQADRLYGMIDRSFARGLARLDEVDALGMSRLELFELWGTARELERVADHAEWIGTVATTFDDALEGSSDDEVREITQLAREIVTDAVSVVVGDASIETAREALVTREQVREERQAFEYQLTGASKENVQLDVLARLGRTAEHGGNIAEIGLRQAIRRGIIAEPNQKIEYE